MGRIDTRWTAKTIKGAANNHRVRILFLLSKVPDMSVTELAETLGVNFRTASEHTKKLVAAGLINKKYQSSTVTHQLTPLGERILTAIEVINQK